MSELHEIVARLRTEAEAQRHLDLPMTVRPSDILAVLDNMRVLRVPRATRPAAEG